MYDADKKKKNYHVVPLPPEYSFQPTINKKSSLIDAVASSSPEKEKSGDEGKEGNWPVARGLTVFIGGTGSPKQRYEKLYENYSVKAERVEEGKKTKEKMELDMCTFHPHVNRKTAPEELNGIKKSEALFNMSKSKKKKDNVWIDVEEYCSSIYHNFSGRAYTKQRNKRTEALLLPA